MSADVQTPRWRTDLSLDAVVCRDLKSSNILLTKEGVAKIGDVGLAKTMVSDYFSYETAVGTCESRPSCMKPCVPDLYSSSGAGNNLGQTDQHTHGLQSALVI